MRNLYRFVLLAAALSVSFASFAAGDAGVIKVSGAWVRATAPGQNLAAVDLSITSEQAATLVGVSTPAARSAELHSMKSEGGMMAMRQVKSIELPAGKTMNLGENGYHLMLVGLKAPLKEGERVPLTLSIKVNKHRLVKIKSMAEVMSLTATRATSHDGEQMKMKMD